ncbi:AAA family ATPase [Micromonospora sp. M12]
MGPQPEYEGAPAAWPWTQVTDALAGPADTIAADDTDDPAGTRFRRHRAVASLISAVADREPVLLVLDDLHRADGDTLDLLTAVLTGPQPASGPVLILGTYRATEISPDLTAALARVARLEPTREYLGALSGPASGELARAVVGADLDPATAQLIHRRSGGNPFFVRELAQLYAAEGRRHWPRCHRGAGRAPAPVGAAARGDPYRAAAGSRARSGPGPRRAQRAG